MLKFNIAAGGFLPSKYKSEIPSQSDFKKFDDCLRMVVDCTNKQEMQINDLLTHAFEQNKIYYGIYTSKAAVSTCVTFTASAGEHIHFVDGEGCGYTMASIQLKQQMKLNPD